MYLVAHKHIWASTIVQTLIKCINRGLKLQQKFKWRKIIKKRVICRTKKKKKRNIYVERINNETENNTHSFGRVTKKRKSREKTYLLAANSVQRDFLIIKGFIDVLNVVIEWVLYCLYFWIIIAICVFRSGFLIDKTKFCSLIFQNSFKRNAIFDTKKHW